MVTSTAADIAVDCLCYRVRRRGRQRPRSVERRGGPREAASNEGEEAPRRRCRLYLYTHALHTPLADPRRGGSRGRRAGEESIDGTNEHEVLWNSRCKKMNQEEEEESGQFDDAP